MTQSYYLIAMCHDSILLFHCHVPWFNPTSHERRVIVGLLWEVTVSHNHPRGVSHCERQDNNPRGLSRERLPRHSQYLASTPEVSVGRVSKETRQWPGKLQVFRKRGVVSETRHMAREMSYEPIWSTSKDTYHCQCTISAYQRDVIWQDTRHIESLERRMASKSVSYVIWSISKFMCYEPIWSTSKDTCHWQCTISTYQRDAIWQETCHIKSLLQKSPIKVTIFMSYEVSRKTHITGNALWGGYD